MQRNVLVTILIAHLTTHGTSDEKCTSADGSNGYCRAKDSCSSGGPGSCPADMTCCRVGDISMKKCREYSKHVNKEDVSAVLLPTRRMDVVSECHINAVPLVVGGEKAHAMEFPHMVAIGYGKTPEAAEWMCGGSLISERFVLSAAHCSQSKDKYNNLTSPAVFARTGILNLNKGEAESHKQDMHIVERILHPQYIPPARYHDIALFRLFKPVELNAFTRPACLHIVSNELSLKRAIATGWGKLNYSDEHGSNDLMKVTLDIIDYTNCNATFVADVGGNIMRNGVIEHQLCAGNLSGGKDTCQGDSGGPLQIIADDPYCMYEVIGITSFGKFCGFKNSPAVYTKVSKYISWIESIVWK